MAGPAVSVFLYKQPTPGSPHWDEWSRKELEEFAPFLTNLGHVSFPHVHYIAYLLRQQPVNPFA